MSTDSVGYSAALERICTETIAPEAPGVDQQGAFPERGLNALAAAGLMGAVSSPEVGGLGLGFRGAPPSSDALAQECGSTAMVVCMHYCGAAVLEAHAPRDVRSAAATRRTPEHARVQRGRIAQPLLGAGRAPPNRTAIGIVLDAQKELGDVRSKATGYVWSSKPFSRTAA